MGVNARRRREVRLVRLDVPPKTNGTGLREGKRQRVIEGERVRERG